MHEQTNDEGYIATDNQLITLVSIGNKRHTLSAYARSLYTILTGEIIKPELDLNNHMKCEKD